MSETTPIIQDQIESIQYILSDSGDDAVDWLTATPASRIGLDMIYASRTREQNEAELARLIAERDAK